MAAQGSDLLVISRGGVLYKLTITELLALAPGGSGSAVAFDTQVDFGTSGRTTYVEKVISAPWVGAGSNISINHGIPTTTDHDPEDALLEQLEASVIAINPGVGITIGVHAPNGAWGRHDLVCIGV